MKEKLKGRKGFTLAELLVVVAIIAILIAIAIPVFAASEEKAREAVDLSAIRAAYAEAKIYRLENGSQTTAHYFPGGGTDQVQITLKQTDMDDWKIADAATTLAELFGSGTYTPKKYATVTLNGDTVSLTFSDTASS